jgi:hypothetical protein
MQTLVNSVPYNFTTLPVREDSYTASMMVRSRRIFAAADESSLWDFHSSDDNRDLVAKINQVYGVDVSDIESAKLWQILDLIATSGVSWR